MLAVDLPAENAAYLLTGQAITVGDVFVVMTVGIDRLLCPFTLRRPWVRPMFGRQ